MMPRILRELSANWKSGLTVALVSVPLSLSLAIASGAAPITGIITAVWAGLIAAALGGSEYNVIGPAGALSGILAGVTLTFGASVLPLVAILAGAVIFAFYILRWDRYLVFIPSSVMHGFTLGVGVTIALGQINAALGLQGLKVHESLLMNFYESLLHAGQTQLPTFILFAATLALLFGIARLAPRIPGAVVAAIMGIAIGYIDRIDATLLLACYVHTYGPLQKSVTTLVQLKGGRVKRTKKQVPLEYSLMVLDEVQNYLPQQLALLQSMTSAFGSRMYVGDLAQQTKLFTVRDWSQVKETFTDANTVKLDKVYRSTKQILEFIQSRGYATHIPTNARVGNTVQTYTYTNLNDCTAYIKTVIERNPEVSIGVVTPTNSIATQLSQHYAQNQKIKVLSIHEAQGVEFDIVCLVDSSRLLAAPTTTFPTNLAEQVKQVNTDLLYVALTRAMNELHVLDPAT
jgi:hypothetical protein